MTVGTLFVDDDDDGTVPRLAGSETDSPQMF